MTDVTRYAHKKSMTLTTIGRKSGQPRSVTVWFVVAAPDEILVQHATAPVAQWYRNLEHNPDVTVDFGDGPMPGRGEPIRDAAGVADVLRRIRSKHWLAGPLIQFKGRKAEKVAARIRILSANAT